jgi:hypothetical protein
VAESKRFTRVDVGTIRALWFGMKTTNLQMSLSDAICYFASAAESETDRATVIKARQLRAECEGIQSRICLANLDNGLEIDLPDHDFRRMLEIIGQ